MKPRFLQLLLTLVLFGWGATAQAQTREQPRIQRPAPEVIEQSIWLREVFEHSFPSEELEELFADPDRLTQPEARAEELVEEYFPDWDAKFFNRYHIPFLTPSSKARALYEHEVRQWQEYQEWNQEMIDFSEMIAPLEETKELRKLRNQLQYENWMRYNWKSNPGRPSGY